MAQDYVALTKAAFEKVDHLFSSEDHAWEYVTEVDGCSMHRFNNPHDIANGIYCVKTEAVFFRTSEEVFNFIWDLKNRKKFDDYGKECRVLEKIEGVEPPIMHSEIMYQSFSMPFPLYHRDFCLIRAYRLLDDHHYTTSAKSVVHPNVPEDPSNHVRGEIIVDGFDVRPDPSNPAHSIVKYVAQVDPKGSIPTFAINLANRKVPQTLSTIRNILHAK